MTMSSSLVNRTSFSAADIVKDIWTSLHLPPHALSSLSLPGHQTAPAAPSSFKIGHLAQSSIALSALTASLIHSRRSSSSSSPSTSASSSSASPIPRVSIPLDHALIEFKSERLYKIDNQPLESVWGSIGGLHKTADGHVRIHDNFPCHALGTLELLGLPPTASREDVAAKVAQWKSVELETEALEKRKLVIYALRSYAEWDALPQASFIDDNPILVRQLASGPPKKLPETNSSRCLQGIRVLEMSRVIAAPVAGKTLAAHGADVLWVTSPNLPNQPVLDRDLGRGKRTIQLDIHKPHDKERLLELLRSCDVFIQGYRPGSLAAYGLSPEELQRANPDIICANLSAFGPSGPWSQRRGFDSLVQTCSGMNVSEAAHFGAGEPARVMPCQALDHAAGYLLAAGVSAALYRRAQGGGSWVVDVSLAGVMKYLRSLGQYPGKTGFESSDVVAQADVPADYLETRETVFGSMRAVRHSASVEGCEVGWEEMPKPLGSDEARWLD
ncbi:CoA-transferase family III domain-containing protein [Trichoderma chlorosporum]